jgi:hypothetical protein
MTNLFVNGGNTYPYDLSLLAAQNLPSPPNLEYDVDGRIGFG